MEALAMGGYGVYVWTCFGLAAVVLIINEWRIRARQAAVYKEIEVRIKALEESA
jgi:heme exporter protein CcmD